MFDHIMSFPINFNYHITLGRNKSEGHEIADDPYGDAVPDVGFRNSNISIHLPPATNGNHHFIVFHPSR